MESFDFKQSVPEDWRESLRWNELPDDVKEEIGRFGLHMFSLGRHVTSEIAEVKYDGRLIILEDGSRWEVDAIDASTCELWNEYSKVVIIDGEMYNIEDAEAVKVEEET